MLSSALTARLAVSAVFFQHGWISGSWVPRIPEFLAQHGIDSGAMGLVIIVFGAGSLLAMPLVGVRVGRAGSRAIALMLAAAMVPALLLVDLAPHLALAGILLFLLGAIMGGLDVAMNAAGVSVERRHGVPVMSSLHGCWSLGGLIGSGLGGPLIAALGTTGHAALVSLAAVPLLIFAARTLADDAPQAEDGTAKARPRLPRRPQIYLIGLLALFAMIPEGAIFDWSALYLRRELGADVTQSGLGFAVFSTVMALARFGGDGLRARIGNGMALRLSAVFAALGVAIIGLAPSIPVALLGCAIAGLGTANMVPIAFGAGGAVPGVPSAQGISIVTSIGYIGILLAPSGIGFIAEITGFAIVYLWLALLPGVVFLLAPQVPAHDTPGDAALATDGAAALPGRTVKPD